MSRNVNNSEVECLKEGERILWSYKEVQAHSDNICATMCAGMTCMIITGLAATSSMLAPYPSDISLPIIAVVIFYFGVALYLYALNKYRKIIYINKKKLKDSGEFPDLYILTNRHWIQRSYDNYRRINKKNNLKLKGAFGIIGLKNLKKIEIIPGYEKSKVLFYISRNSLEKTYYAKISNYLVRDLADTLEQVLDVKLETIPKGEEFIRRYHVKRMIKD